MNATKTKKIIAISVSLLAFFVSFGFFVPTAAAVSPTLAHTVGNTVSDAAGTVTNTICGEGGLGQCVINVYSWIALIAFQIGIFLLAISGALLDFSLVISFKMGEWVSMGQPLGEAVRLGWTVLRDLGNLLFIAALVWASIEMILSTEILGISPGKIIVNVIIAAVLVNFSYFFAGVLIDASNIVSREIYQAGLASSEVQIEPLFSEIAGPLNSAVKSVGLETSLTGTFLQQTRLSSLFSQNILNPDTPRDTKFILMLSSSVLLLFITARIFFTIFLSILARFAILLILLITSPVMLLSLIHLGPLQSWGKQWWKALTSQLLFLPIFLLLISFSFNVIGALVEQLQTKNVGFGDIFSKPGEVISVLAVYLLAYILLRISLTAAQSISQGKDVGLPGVDVLQAPAAKYGAGLGDFATKTPRRLFNWGVGQFGGRYIVRKAREGAGAVQEGIQEVDAQLGRVFPLNLVPGEDYQTRQAQKAARRRRGAALENILNKYAGAPDKLTSSDDQKAIRDWAEGRSDKEIADFLTNKKPDERERIIESIPPDRRENVRKEIRSPGSIKGSKKEGEKSEGDEGSTPSSKQGGGQTATRNTEQKLDRLFTEMGTMHADQVRENSRARRNDWLKLAATKRGFNEISSKFGSLGKVMPPEIISEDIIANQIGTLDLTDLAARSDVTNQQLRSVVNKLKQLGRNNIVREAGSSPAGFRIQSLRGGDQ